MYKEKQEKLIKKINNILENSDYRNIKEVVGTELRKRNLDSPIIILSSEIIMRNAKVEQLVKEEDNDIKYLYFFTDALNKAFKAQDDSYDIIILENYFLKSEVEELKDYVAKDKQEKVYPVTIENITKINDHHYLGTISGKELHRLNSAKVIIYNPKTQRDPKITKHGEKIRMFQNKISEISQQLQDKTYEPDELIWNILQNGNEKYDYNNKSRTLTIFEGSIINVVDGQNRKEANSDAMHKNPDLDHIWVVSILNVSELKAHEIMVQKNKQTPMSKEWLGTKDYNKPENRVLNIMSDEKSKIFDIMKETDTHITKNQALVKKSNIALAISEIYGDDLVINDEVDGDNVRIIGRWLAEFFDYMIKLYSYDFKEKPYEVKEYSFINWKNMFYGYVALSKVLKDKEDWRNLFKKKMESLNFLNSNPKWQNIGMLNTKDANVTLRKNLYNLFREDIE